MFLHENKVGARVWHLERLEFRNLIYYDFRLWKYFDTFEKKVWHIQIDKMCWEMKFNL